MSDIDIYEEELKQIDKMFFEMEAEKYIMDKAYTTFYQKGSILSKKRYENIAKKRELLSTIFPEQFGKGGRESVYEMTNGDVGVLFNNLMVYSEKRVNELEEKARTFEKESALKRFKEKTSYP